MAKKRQSLSLSEENKAFLDRDDINASGLADKLISQYRSGGAHDRQMLNLRKNQIEAEIDSLENQIEHKRKELEKVENNLEQYTTDLEAKLDEAEDLFEPRMLTTDNPGVKNWADKCGIGPNDFISRMEDRLE